MSGVVDILGDPSAFAQGKKFRWQQGGGESNTQAYRGPVEAVRVVYNAYKQAALIDPSIVVVDFDEGKGLGELIIQTVDPSTLLGTQTAGGITKVYELFANEICKRAEQSYYFSGPEPISIDGIIKAYKSYDEGLTDSQVQPGGGHYELAGKPYELWQLIVQGGGNPEFYESMPVLRESKFVSGATAVAQQFTNINQVETPPVSFAANKLISQLPFDNIEWLKKYPTATQVTKKKWKVQTEWWGANHWSKVQYGGTGTP